jgi:hypothetical protein
MLGVILATTYPTDEAYLFLTVAVVLSNMV